MILNNNESLVIRYRKIYKGMKKILILINLVMLLMIFYSLNFIAFSILSIFISTIIYSIMCIISNILECYVCKDSIEIKSRVIFIYFFVLTVGCSLLTEFEFLGRNLLSYGVRMLLLIVGIAIINRIIR